MPVLAPQTLLPFPLGYMGITLMLDQDDTALILAGTAQQRLTDWDPGVPEDQPTFATTRDMDGDQLIDTRFGNRQVTAEVRLYCDTDEELQNLVAALDAKIDKLRREGGVLVCTLPSGEPHTLQVLAGAPHMTWDKRWVNRPCTTYGVKLTCGPFWHDAEREITLDVQQTAPCVIATATDPVPGSVPALGRLIIINESAADQQHLIWAAQSRTYDPAATAALFYQAEDLTPLGDASTSPTAGHSGTSAVVNGAIPADTYVAAVTTGEATHTGTYRVWARCRPDTSHGVTLTIALEWAVGDFRSFTRNAPVTIDDGWDSYWRLLDLGLVSIADSEAWEGRVIVKTSEPSTDAVSIDCVYLAPAEISGEATGLQQAPTATEFEALDDFDQTAGALVGKTLPIGGTWAGVGDSTDFSVDGSGLATRDATSDTAPRIDYADATDLAGVKVGARVTVTLGTSTAYSSSGVVARFVDDDNWLAGYLYRSTLVIADGMGVRVIGRCAIVLRLKIDGSLYVLGTAQHDDEVGWETDVTADLELQVSASGVAKLEATLDSGARLSTQGFHVGLASGGELESGAIGIYDYAPEADTRGSEWDRVYAYAVPADPAIFAGKSIEIRHDRVVRAAATGTDLTRVSRYAGDHLLVPAAGSQDRSVRLIAKTTRGAPADGVAADWQSDELDARLRVTPRWLTLPGST